MSLKDLLGLFDSDKKIGDTSNLNVSLQQGANFNSMQSRIESSVEPQLALIEQTTEPGLGSIVENFSGNSSELPLVKVNTAEYKELQVLEDDFNKALSQYTQKQNAMMGGLQRPTLGKAYTWDTIKDSILWQGEKSATECAAACNANSKCTAWETCNNGRKGEGCAGCYLINKDGIAPPNDGSDSTWNAGLVNKKLQGTLKNQLDTMFKALQTKASILHQKTMALHSQHQQLSGSGGELTQQKASSLQQLQNLQGQQNRLNKLMTEGDTLSAEIYDNTLQMNAAYMRYFVWFGAAVTLGLVAMHRAAK